MHLCVCSVLFYVSLGCQDVSSLGNNLSICFVFRQGGSVAFSVHLCVCYVSLGCQDVSSLGRGVLCVCSVLCEPWLSMVVKMFRLWATTCQDVSSLGRGVQCASVCMFCFM